MNLVTRRIRNSALLLVLLAVFVGVAPRFLHLPAFRDEIVNQLSRELSCDVSFAEIRWTWLPFPHLTLRKARLEFLSAEITLQEAQLYPHWRVLLGDITRIGRAHLIAPDIKIHALSGPNATGPTALPIVLPRATVTIKDGRLTYIPPDSTLPFKKEALTLSRIKASITSRADQVSVRMQATSPFSRTMTIKGALKPSTLDYAFSVDVKDFIPAQLLPALAGGVMIPLDQAISFNSQISGSVKEKRLSASIKGVSPSFLLKSQAGSFRLQGGEMDLSVDVTDSGVSTVIHQLEITKPALNLQGTVGHYQPLTKGDAEPPPAQWQINLAGSDLDLGEIRAGLLRLWPENPTASRVCDVVRSGIAKQIRFRISGPAEHFSHLKTMNIEVDVADAAIHVPEVDLDLTRANGPITIINGILSGQGLSAALGNSRGRNGKIFLGLTPDDHSFILDLDLDVDLAELPPVLNKVVADKKFLAELSHFSSSSGKASGHLRLKDRLDNIFAEISVNSITGKTYYDRIPWPISIEGGELKIVPEKVSWQDINTRIGPHGVSGLQGEAVLNDPTLFTATIATATLDGEQLLRELSARDLLPVDLADSVSSLSGSLHLADAKVHGPLSSPDDWQYDLKLSTDALQWTSPLIDGENPKTRATALFRNGEILIENAEADLFGEALILDGKLEHTGFSNWQGALRFNGSVSEAAHSWLVSHHLLPSSLPLKLPITLRNMAVAWDNNRTTAKGDISPGKPDQETRAHIDLTVTDDSLNIKELQLISTADQGVLSATFNRTPPQHITFSWDGAVHADTINSLLQTDLLSGTMNGSIRSTLTPRPDSTWIEGSLTAKDLQWTQQDSAIPELKIESLDILGNGPTTTLNRLDVRLDDALMTLSGSATPSLGALNFDLALHADTIQGNRLLQFWEGAKKNWPQTTTSRLTGKLNFAIGTLLWSPEPRTTMETSPEEAPTPAPTYLVNPAIGEIIMPLEQAMSLNLTSAGLCGLDISGSWYADPETAQSYTITTPPDGVLFQEVLPCLGFDQDVIEGKFTLNAELLRQGDKWKGKSATIRSKEGTILRMRLLSKIFKVINITDMFTRAGETSGKGLSYSTLDIETSIADDTLVVDRGVIRGHGLNLYGKGDLNLTTMDSDLIILIAPLKTLDAIMAKVPLVGRIIGGENATVMTFPVGVKGNIKDPRIYALPPEAIGDAVISMVKETLLLPVRILSPILPKKKKSPPDKEKEAPGLSE